MEKKFFDWDKWDQVDDFALQFYDCTLKVDIGEHKAGETINFIVVDFEKGVMDIYGEDDTISESFSLELTIVKKIK